MPCLDDHTILAYFHGELAADVAGAIEAELDRCADCRELMLAIAGDWRRNDDALGDRLRPGTALGRYVIEDELGEGAMGRVYRARDPELARSIAVKVLARPSESLSSRLRTEAQTMARLNHRNVVQVFDVGDEDTRVFVAMEEIRGATLRQWLATPHPVAETLDRFAQAADGLAAAHGAGIVHRDFKPENVLVGDDGVVRVGDFGLAIGSAPDAAQGTPAGTPAYLAPEIRRGEPATAASDQYAFWVALHEAIAGTRPEPGVASKLRPRRLAKAIERGLEPDPARRFPTMTAVAAELRTIASARRRRLVALALAGGAIAIALVTWLVVRGGSEGPSCEVAGRELDGVWSPSRAVAVHRAVLGTGKRYAPAAAATLVRGLDDYAERWRASALAACRATNVEHTQSAELLDRRAACLADRRAELAAVIDQVTASPKRAASDAVALVDGLSAIAVCDDVATLQDEPLPPREAGTAGKLAATRAQIAGAKAHFLAGTFAQGVPAAEAAVRSARELGYAPVLAEALETLGGLQQSAGKPDAAVKTLEEALVAAEASRHPHASTAIRLRLAETYVELGKPDEARRVIALGRATAEAIRSDKTVAEYDELVGVIESDANKNPEALAAYERALAVMRRLDGEDGPSTGHLIGLIGLVHEGLGHVDEARTHLERARAITEKHYGKAHPNYANALSNLASLLFTTTDRERGLELAREAHAIRVASLPPDHPELAMSWSNLGSMLQLTGKLPEAREAIGNAIAVKTRVLGEDHPSTGVSHVTLGKIQLALGDRQGALASAERGLAIVSAKLGDAHPYTAAAHAAYADALLANNKLAETIPHYEAAIAHMAAAQSFRERFNLAQVLDELKREPARVRALVASALVDAKAAHDDAAVAALLRMQARLH
ncbi:MAG TPA: tetratricopeptide repeat protein [Kofleriaceae bacterium]|nr:tetratricopeptide repeat protein [Kofleriaceae bacterium]